jgi:enoyl-CoA hydratase/carnithine racemase
MTERPQSPRQSNVDLLLSQRHDEDALPTQLDLCGKSIGSSIDRYGKVSKMYEDIIYEVSDPVATITLNRPASMNAWTNTMDLEIKDAIGRACADRAVVGIIITGAGRAFCAGADMKTLSALTEAAPAESAGASSADSSSERAPREVDGDFSGRFPYLMMVDKPIIAAINGAVAGMAYPFSLCCDLRVVTPDAVFLTAFAQRGLIAEWGLSWLLPRLVGPAVAMDLLLSSRKVRGEEAHAIGLANYLVQPDELLTFCRAYIEQLATSSSPTSMAIMKLQVYEQLHQGLGVADAQAGKLMTESFSRSDFKEGVKSFLEKRPPNFNRLPL